MAAVLGSTTCRTMALVQRPIMARRNGAPQLPDGGAAQAAESLARLGQSSLEAGRVGGSPAMREPCRAVRRHRFGRKDREAFGITV